MFLDRLSLKNLRNIKEANLTLHNKTNVVIGENAAGKTTLLEAVDILSRGRSFRTNKTENLVRHGASGLYVGGTTGQKFQLVVRKKKNSQN